MEIEMHAVLTAGKYKAVDPCTVAAYHHQRQLGWTEYPAGAVIEVPRTVNGFRYCLWWWCSEYDCPDTGEPQPRIEVIE
jgi:hypothetical protein